MTDYEEVVRLRGKLEALRKARERIATMPTREEWLGGQRTKYVQVDEVLAFIDEALKP